MAFSNCNKFIPLNIDYATMEKRLTVILTGSCLFYYLFWGETSGLNILVFNFFLITSAFLFYPGLIKSREAIATIIASFVTALFVVLHGSDFVIITHWLSLFLMVAFIHQVKLRSIEYALPTAFVNYLQLPGKLISKMYENKKYAGHLRKFNRVPGIIIAPFVFFIVFYFLFKYANPEFEKLTNGMLESIGNWISHISQNISFPKTLFFLVGFFLMAGFIYNNHIGQFMEREASLSDYILRKNKIDKLKNTRKFRKLSLGLKEESRAAILMISMVNLMLLVVNFLDVKWVWLGFSYTTDVDLKNFVHEGTYLLIISILLSITIMLYYFRQNLNFYPGRNILKSLAYVWIIQNVVLLVSVFIRNYYYIQYFGLAYKRIGVVIFLLMVLFGLYTLLVKIKSNRSISFLFRYNSWCVYIIIFLSSLLNWDRIIVGHNLSHPMKDNIETSFLLTLSDKILPEIEEHKEILGQSPQMNTYRFFPVTYHDVYKERVMQFLERKQKDSWLSWNWEEQKAHDFYRNKRRQ